METLIPPLVNHIRALSADVEKQRDSGSFREGMAQYLSLLEPSITRYQHHQGSEVDLEQIKERFKYETAFLHLLTKVLAYETDGKQINWPIYEAASPYKWYELPPALSVKELVAHLSNLDSPALAISQVSGLLLDKAIKRYLGEFYTPPPIAEHLIELSGLQPTDLLNGKRVIDPACGGGIILVMIANKLVSLAREENLPAAEVLESLSQNLFGFDIQPFAVVITRTLLIYSCRSLLAEAEWADTAPLFPNIQLQDALVTHPQYWTENEGLFQLLPDNKGFDVVISNPPFMSAKKKHMDYIKHYENILSGHPNLYQLFLWWAVRAAKQGGKVTFLVPQSMLSGFYFRKLREQLDKHTTLISLTRMIDHKGVVGKADLQMMAICLKATREASIKSRGIEVRVTRNGDDISSSEPITVQYSEIIQKVEKGSVFWVVSDNTLDYAIAKRVREENGLLAHFTHIFKFGNGNYVWNQHKELLQEKEIEANDPRTEKESLPLISATNVGLYGFTFPYIGSHASHKRQFSLLGDKVHSKIHSQPALLIQRTTPNKVGRRLVVGMPSQAFYKQYSKSFIENHVIYIKTVNAHDTELLYGLVGWLNSDLINFFFQLRNGSSSVSVYELGLLPVNLEVIKQLVEPTKAIFQASGSEREAKIKMLNKLIYDRLGLESSYQKRITTVLNRKAKGYSYNGK
jgi:adenine-specific DNA-methyltransferase